jgi:dynein assembly factor 3, axonemal
MIPRCSRLRHHYGTRYDYRDNLVDWDYTTLVKACNGCIHSRQFRTWRNTGVAFELGDQVYTAPNRSLASFVEGGCKCAALH